MARFEDEEKSTDESAPSEEPKIILLNSPSGDSSDDPKIRKCMLYGDINEEQAKDLIATMILLGDTAEVEEPVNPEDPESEFKTTVRPRDRDWETAC